MPRKSIFWVLTLTALIINRGCASKSNSTAGESLSPAAPVAAAETANDAPTTPKSPGANLTNLEGQQLETIYFDFDSYVLNPAAHAVLKKNALLLSEKASMSITIEGYCDERGSDEYNLALGDQRAKVIKDYLVALGISPNRLATISYGEENPVAQGHDENSWKMNRRVAFN